MLAMEYLFKYQDRVKAAVLCNMTASGKAYATYTNELKHRLLSSEDVVKLDALDRAGKWESPEYQTILMEKLYPQVICRLNPWPDPVMRGLRKLNTKVYNTIQGVDEFHVTGSMKDWDVWGRLKDIRVPTLLIGATHDEMNPEEIKDMGRRIPNSTVYICPDGSHLSMYDDQENFFRALLAFLKGTEAKAARAATSR